MHDLRVLSEAGRLVVRKDAADATGRSRLAHEHHVLRRIAGPGIPAVIAWDPDETSLVVDHCGAAAASRVQTARRAIEVVADAADIVHRLHTAGWAHSAVTAEHVLVDAAGRVSLCGLAAATPADDGSRSADVTALRRLLEHLLHGTAEARPAVRRWTRHGSSDDLAERALETAAGGGDASRSAQRLRSLLPSDATLAPKPPKPVGAALRRRAIAVASSPSLVVGGGATIGVLLAVAMLGPAGTPGTEITSTPPVPPSTANAATSTSPSPTEATTTTTRPPPSTAPAVVVTLDGRFATVDGRHIAVGTEGDVVVVGDWDCDGVATAAVLRPGTGSVFVFDDWPESGTVEIEPHQTIEGLVELQVSGDVCPTLLGIDRAGTSRELT